MKYLFIILFLGSCTSTQRKPCPEMVQNKMLIESSVKPDETESIQSRYENENNCFVEEN